MSRDTRHLLRTTLIAAGLLAAASGAQAGLLDQVSGALKGKDSQQEASSNSVADMLGGMTGNSAPSLDAVGNENVAGVLQYCIKNQFVGGDASSVSSKLTGLLGGEQKAESSTDYKEGLAGILGGDSDRKVDLNSPGIKQQLTDKVCGKVLEYGKSLL